MTHNNEVTTTKIMITTSSSTRTRNNKTIIQTHDKTITIEIEIINTQQKDKRTVNK